MIDPTHARDDQTARVCCSNCRHELPAEYARGAVVEPCPRCGRLAELSVTVAEGRRVVDDAQALATVSNDVAAELDALNGSIGDLELATAQADARGAQNAAKAALEALHELGDDPLKLGGWSQDAWSAEERELTVAFAGARNAAHHKSAAVVQLEVGADARNALRWIATLPPIHSDEQTKAYYRRLAGQPVLPALRYVAERIAESIAGVIDAGEAPAGPNATPG
jgi:hypothetical protein